MKIRSVGAIAVCGAGESFHDGEGTAEVKRPEKLCHFPEESVSAVSAEPWSEDGCRAEAFLGDVLKGEGSVPF